MASGKFCSHCGAPLTGAACLWYHAKIEEWRSNRDSTNRSDWHTVRVGTSSEPFVLRDSSGECVVFPDGADTMCTDRSVWFGATPLPADKNPPRKGPGDSAESTVKVYGAADKKYRYTEERIYGGDPLYALGPFSTAAPAGHARWRPRQGGTSRSPAAARATASGAESSAVASVSVANWPARMTIVKPAGRSSGPGNRSPAASSRRRPQPSDRPPSTSGYATQATSKEVS